MVFVSCRTTALAFICCVSDYVARLAPFDELSNLFRIKTFNCARLRRDELRLNAGLWMRYEKSGSPILRLDMEVVGGSRKVSDGLIEVLEIDVFGATFHVCIEDVMTVSVTLYEVWELILNPFEVKESKEMCV